MCSPGFHRLSFIMDVYVCFDMYSIFDGNENVMDFLLLQSCRSASCYMMIVSKSFVWSKNNYADERI